jgi:hypothetical protein
MLEALMRRIRRRRMLTLKPFGQVDASALRVSLGDLSAGVVERLAYHFHGLAAVEVVQGNLLDLDCQAIVSPGWRPSPAAGPRRGGSLWPCRSRRPCPRSLGPDEAAEQMRVAYDSVVGGKWREVVHPVQAHFALGSSRRPKLFP